MSLKVPKSGQMQLFKEGYKVSQRSRTMGFTVAKIIRYRRPCLVLKKPS